MMMTSRTSILAFLFFSEIGILLVSYFHFSHSFYFACPEYYRLLNLKVASRVKSL